MSGIDPSRYEVRFVGKTELQRTDDGVSVAVTPALDHAGVDPGTTLEIGVDDPENPVYLLGTVVEDPSEEQTATLYGDDGEVRVDVPTSRLEAIGIDPESVGEGETLQLYAARDLIAFSRADGMEVVVEDVLEDVEPDGRRNYAVLVAVTQHNRENQFEVYFDRESEAGTSFEISIRPLHRQPYDQMPRTAALAAVDALRLEEDSVEVDVAECTDVVSDDAYQLTV